MRNIFISILFLPLISISEISLRVNWPPPTDCGNGCDHTAGYPTGNCYQCPSGGVETVKCQGKPDAPAAGHLCERQLYWYRDWQQCMCWDACDGCKSNVYSNYMGLSMTVVPSLYGFTLYATVPYQVPCHWCLGNPQGYCNTAGMCVIENYNSSKNCGNASMNDKFCEPRFEQGIWYPVLGVGCSYAGTTQSYTSRLERCTGSYCGTYTANSLPFEVTFPPALEAGCKAAPDWECCEDESGSNCAGGPINVSSGNMHYEEIDFTIDDISGFSFKRSYNNQETDLNVTGGVMGYGWTHTFNQRMVQTNTLPDGRRILRHLTEEGIKKYYLETYPSSNEFEGYWPYDLKGKVEDDGTYYILKDYDGNQVKFTKSNGLWAESCDFYGNCYVGSYTSSKLSSVTDPLGRTITFTYNASNRLTEVTLWDGKKFKYSYLSNYYLEKVFYPTNTTALVKNFVSGIIYHQRILN